MTSVFITGSVKTEPVIITSSIEEDKETLDQPENLESLISDHQLYLGAGSTDYKYIGQIQYAFHPKSFNPTKEKYTPPVGIIGDEFFFDRYFYQSTEIIDWFNMVKGVPVTHIKRVRLRLVDHLHDHYRGTVAVHSIMNGKLKYKVTVSNCNTIPYVVIMSLSK